MKGKIDSNHDQPVLRTCGFGPTAPGPAMLPSEFADPSRPGAGNVQGIYDGRRWIRLVIGVLVGYPLLGEKLKSWRLKSRKATKVEIKLNSKNKKRSAEIIKVKL